MNPDRVWIQSLLQRHEEPLVRYATRLLGGDVQRARDVVQDSFLRLCQAPRERVEGHAEAWLFAVCRNRAIDVCRKEGRMGPLEHAPGGALASQDAGPGELTARRQAHARLARLMSTLPPDEARALRLKLAEHKTYREISAEMGTSLGRVSKLITSAMETLRTQLADEAVQPVEVRS
ncbi:MAG: sigma-70 family RNA polymerase sigma factor [Pseudomonadota bacterium]